MDRDDYATQMDTALEHLRRAAEILFELDGMEYAANKVEDVLCEVEEELAELDSLND
jgi:hypothetical protein